MRYIVDQASFPASHAPVRPRAAAGAFEGGIPCEDAVGKKEAALFFSVDERCLNFSDWITEIDADTATNGRIVDNVFF